MSQISVQTILEPRGPAAAIILTDDQVAELGGAKATPVVVTINGRTVQLRLARMGGENLIGFSKAVRSELGLEIGADIDATISLDAAERTVELPAALIAVLDAHPGARQAFDSLSYSQRKEHARQIAEAKQDATRERRLAKILTSLTH